MDPILRETLDLCYQDHRSARSIAECAGVSHMVINHWRKSGGAQVATVAAMLGALGYRLKIERIAPQNYAQKSTRQPVSSTQHDAFTGS